MSDPVLRLKNFFRGLFLVIFAGAPPEIVLDALPSEDELKELRKKG